MVALTRKVRLALILSRVAPLFLIQFDTDPLDRRVQRPNVLDCSLHTIEFLICQQDSGPNL